VALALALKIFFMSLALKNVHVLVLGLEKKKFTRPRPRLLFLKAESMITRLTIFDEDPLLVPIHCIHCDLLVCSCGSRMLLRRAKNIP